MRKTNTRRHLETSTQRALRTPRFWPVQRLLRLGRELQHGTVRRAGLQHRTLPCLLQARRPRHCSSSRCSRRPRPLDQVPLLFLSPVFAFSHASGSLQPLHAHYSLTSQHSRPGFYNYPCDGTELAPDADMHDQDEGVSTFNPNFNLGACSPCCKR